MEEKSKRNALNCDPHQAQGGNNPGEINFPEDQGKWVIFSPTPYPPRSVPRSSWPCGMAEEFAELNMNCWDYQLTHSILILHIKKIQEIEWKDMKNIEVKFPLIEDIKMDVANKYGMVQPGQSDTQAVRAVFVIDPEAKIRTILYYPLSLGRNFDELKRIIQALQKADKEKVATPADWRPGDDLVVPTAGSCGTAKERMESQDDDMYCLDWFMCFRKDK